MPDDATAHNKRGIEAARGGNLQDALAHFDRAVALKLDYAEAYNNRALILQDLNRLDDALASLDRALALTPDNARAHNNRGALLQDLSRFDEALAAHDKALLLKPDFAEAQFNQATALRALKRARRHQGSRKSREQEVISSTYVFSCFSASFSRSCLLVGTVLYRVHGSNFRSCEPNRRGGCALLLVYRAELSGRVTLVTYLRRWNPSDACHTNSHSRRRLAGMGHDGYKPPRCTTTS
jgi:tetratricopeptide (TPR) repeat protein